MNQDTYKKYTLQAKRGIKGEAFFESLISEYSIPHSIVGPKDVGVDYICEWVHGYEPTGILFAVQIKTFSEETASPKFVEVEARLNGLQKYMISNPHLKIDKKTLHYWKGLGMPVYLFAIVQTTDNTGHENMDCYYKRFTQVLTTGTKQDGLGFYKVNRGMSFIAFADEHKKIQGFARDLFIDYIRWSYHKGSITYLNPRSIGLNQFPEENSLFQDMVKEYREQVCATYSRTRDFLEMFCRDSDDKNP